MLAARFGVMSAEKLMTQILEYSNVAGQLRLQCDVHFHRFVHGLLFSLVFVCEQDD